MFCHTSILQSRTLRRAALALVYSATLACTSAGKSIDPWDAVGHELLALEAEDRAVREELAESRRLGQPDANVAARMRAIDRRHGARLKELVRAHGWPRPSQVGRDAAGAAWVLLMHADQEPGFQAQVLESVRPFLARGDVSGEGYALMTDRLLVSQGRRQRYGTQYIARSIDGVLHFGPSTPIDDPGGLNRRRAEIGLVPHEEFVEALREGLNVPIHAPAIPGPDAESSADSVWSADESAGSRARP